MEQILASLGFKPATLFVLLFAGISVAFFCYYWYAATPRKDSLEWITMRQEKPRRLAFPKRYSMERPDILPLLLVTALYALTAFFRLGNVENIQSNATMLRGDSVSFSLPQEAEIGEVRYFTGIGTGSYVLEYTSDGVTWNELKVDQSYKDLLRWKTVTVPNEKGEDVTAAFTAKIFRLTAYPDRNSKHPGREYLELGELAVFDSQGFQLTPSYVEEGGDALFDEQGLVEQNFHTNSSYFDEIYHPRTAKEHLDGVYPYEVSHPPLGKLIIALGIELFGMTPFGWRFMGTLFGVLMLPLLYLFLKNMFGKTAVATCGTILFAAEFMHLTQTRIATIDTYGVFFILAMYYFMYRWLTLPADAGLGRTIPALFLCGLMFGIGVASKWTVIYGGVGLAVLWLIGLILKCRDRSKGSVGFVFGTIGVCLVFFVVIPAAIYLASYIPYVTAEGELTLPALWKTVWDNQVFMLTYHQGVTSAHPYSSRWYQWLFDIRPILYFREMHRVPGMKAAFAAFHNPLISWAGLLCVILTAIETVRRKCGRALFLFVAYLAQLLPWVFIGRTTFAYHYFPSVLFCVFAMAYAMDGMLARRKKGRWLAVGGVTAAAVVLYAAFYPVLTGLYVPQWYTTYFLRWLTSWPF